MTDLSAKQTTIPEGSLEDLSLIAEGLLETTLSEYSDTDKIQIMNIAYDQLRHKTSQQILQIEADLKQKKINLEAFTFMPKKV